MGSFPRAEAEPLSGPNAALKCNSGPSLWQIHTAAFGVIPPGYPFAFNTPLAGGTDFHSGIVLTGPASGAGHGDFARTTQILPAPFANQVQSLRPEPQNLWARVRFQLQIANLCSRSAGTS